MHLSWQKHQELSRIVSNAADKDSGTGLALMGIALTILAKDLLMYETRSSVTSAWREIGLSWAIIQVQVLSSVINLLLLQSVTSAWGHVMIQSGMIIRIDDLNMVTLIGSQSWDQMARGKKIISCKIQCITFLWDDWMLLVESDRWAESDEK